MRIAIAVFALLLSLPAARAQEQEEELAPLLRGCLVKVYATTQSWDATSPWNKGGPRPVAQRGIVVRPGLVLTPASGLADLRMVELSVANSARRYPAKLEHIDYSANLALVRIDDDDLLARTAPIPVGEPITIDDEAEIWQLGASDLLERSTALVQQVYASGNDLILTVKTNLSGAGNGQAVIRNGKLCGLVIQTRSMSQEGRILSIETIGRFLDDFDSGEYQGFGAGGIWTQDLLRDDLRAYFGAPDDVHGLAITRVNPGCSGAEVLRAGDVLDRFAGHDLDDEGMFEHPFHGRLSWAWLLLGQTHPGDEVPATVWRDGVKTDVTVTIRRRPASEHRVPNAVRDHRPPYLVVGGMVILELTRLSRVQSYSLRRYQQRAEWDPPEDRKRIVYASRVLSDEATKGLEDLGSVAIVSVNGKKITRIEDVAEALAAPQNGFHVFLFEDLVKPYVIRAADLDAIDARIAERYRIPELRYLPTEPEDD